MRLSVPKNGIAVRIPYLLVSESLSIIYIQGYCSLLNLVISLVQFIGL